MKEASFIFISSPLSFHISQGDEENKLNCMNGKLALFYIQGQIVGKMVVSSDQNSFFTFPLKAQPRGLFKTRKKRCFLKTVAVEKDVPHRQHLRLL